MRALDRLGLSRLRGKEQPAAQPAAAPETSAQKLRPVEAEEGVEEELAIGEYPAAIAAAEDTLLDKHAKLAAVKKLDNLEPAQRNMIYGPSSPIGQEYAKVADLRSKWQAMVTDATRAETKIRQWGEGTLTPQQQEVLAAKKAADDAANQAMVEGRKQQYSGQGGENPVLVRQHKLQEIEGRAQGAMRALAAQAEDNRPRGGAGGASPDQPRAAAAK
jgi:hypothetical protein